MTDKQKKQSVPITIMLKLNRKDESKQNTLTQMVSPSPQKMDVKENNVTKYMVSRKAISYHRTKMRRVVHNGQRTMTQMMSLPNASRSVKKEPFVLTQLDSDYPTSPSASVIDLLSQASSDMSENLLPSDISENLLPEVTNNKTMGAPLALLGPVPKKDKA